MLSAQRVKREEIVSTLADISARSSASLTISRRGIWESIAALHLAASAAIVVFSSIASKSSHVLISMLKYFAQ
jgi:hypothetical protein